MPLFPRAGWQRKRIIRAACHLHDVSWRAHPDYRAEVTFDNATRANLGGLKHQERVFLGTALLNRYGNKSTGSRLDPLFEMLTEAEHLEAAILGKAMRLGAMLWLNADEAPGVLKWKPKARELTLVLSHATRPLFGEVAEARTSLPHAPSMISRPRPAQASQQGQVLGSVQQSVSCAQYRHTSRDYQIRHGRSMTTGK